MTTSELERIRIIALADSKPPDDCREILNGLLAMVADLQSEIDELEDWDCDCDDIDSVADDVSQLERRLRAIEKLIAKAAK